MKSASVKEIKTTLDTMSARELLSICLRLAKFKKENKELLTYLLFEADDESAYVQHIKDMLEEEFSGVNSKSIYIAKKNIRRIIRLANRYIKYSELKTTKVEVMMFVAASLTALPAEVSGTLAIQRVLLSQLTKIKALIADLHEDLQYDYYKQLELLSKK